MSETLELACPACLAINRVAYARLDDNPVCGRCRAALFTGTPVTLTATNAATIIQRTQLPVLVDCWASWCGPCVQFAPIFADAARRLEPRLRFAKVDVDAEPQVVAGWAIRSIPTLILFHEGKEVKRVAGALPMNELMRWLHESGLFE